MFAFRDAFRRGDAGKRIDDRVGGERVISERGSLRRRGADEAWSSETLSLDLLSLVNTVDLASAVDLTGSRLRRAIGAELRPARLSRI